MRERFHKQIEATAKPGIGLAVLTFSLLCSGCRPSAPAVTSPVPAVALPQSSPQSNGLPRPEEVFTVASSPLMGKEFVHRYDAQTLPALLPRLKLRTYLPGYPPEYPKDYLYQDGVMVLKDKRVFYWRAVFDGKVYSKNKVVGFIQFIPESVNDIKYYALP
jgi:hypothetical protein